MGLTLPLAVNKSASVFAELGPTWGPRRSGEASLDIIKRRAWADAGARRSSPPVFAACVSKRPPGGGLRISDNKELAFISMSSIFPAFGSTEQSTALM
jgi:hypothetical protein